MGSAVAAHQPKGNDMQATTINVTGLGRVYVKTSEKTARLAGAIALDGTPVNVSTHKVSSAKAHHADAARNDAAGHYLREVGAGVFMLASLDDTE